MRLLGMVVLLLPAVAFAAPEPSEDAESYCTFVRSVTKSESALLFSPQLFLDYGVVNGNDVSTGTGGVSSAPPTNRLTFGLRYSFVGLYQGVAARQRATADCERYRMVSGLNRFLTENREQVSPASLDAKLAILKGADPKAREIVKMLRMAVEHARATADELHAAELRLEELESQAAEFEALRAGLPSRTALPPPSELIERHLAAELEVEKYEARLRESRAFDVSVRGGYDQFFGQRDVLPLFVVLSLTVNPAAIYQPFADADARKSRVRWARAMNEGVDQKVELLANRLRAALEGERRRLRDTTVLLADVEGRIRSLEGIEGDRIRRVREAMWFDWVKLKADHEFLRVHVAELGSSLGGDAR
jgi:hypothetical protein